MRLRLILPLAAAVFGLTACSTSTDPKPEATPAAAITTTAPEPTPADTSDDMTQLVVDLSWAQQTEDDKDAMCLGIALGGPEWAAEQMRTGAGDESVDWDRAAELITDKCANR